MSYLACVVGVAVVAAAVVVVLVVAAVVFALVATEAISGMLGAEFFWLSAVSSGGTVVTLVGGSDFTGEFEFLAPISFVSLSSDGSLGIEAAKVVVSLFVSSNNDVFVIIVGFSLIFSFIWGKLPNVALFSVNGFENVGNFDGFMSLVDKLEKKKKREFL